MRCPCLISRRLTLLITESQTPADCWRAPPTPLPPPRAFLFLITPPHYEGDWESRRAPNCPKMAPERWPPTAYASHHGPGRNYFSPPSFAVAVMVVAVPRLETLSSFFLLPPSSQSTRGSQSAIDISVLSCSTGSFQRCSVILNKAG